ncbi:MAG TPA: hypothetical protein VGD67_21210 [Pseudonocardiaceae bacterium]
MLALFLEASSPHISHQAPLATLTTHLGLHAAAVPPNSAGFSAMIGIRPPSTGVIGHGELSGNLSRRTDHHDSGTGGVASQVQRSIRPEVLVVQLSFRSPHRVR